MKIDMHFHAYIKQIYMYIYIRMRACVCVCPFGCVSV